MFQYQTIHIQQVLLLTVLLSFFLSSYSFTKDPDPSAAYWRALNQEECKPYCEPCLKNDSFIHGLFSSISSRLEGVISSFLCGGSLGAGFALLSNKEDKAVKRLALGGGRI